MKNKHLANVFRAVGESGKDGFYRGWVADNVVSVMETMGGLMTHKDLESHYNTFPEPIYVEYKGDGVCCNFTF